MHIDRLKLRRSPEEARSASPRGRAQGGARQEFPPSRRVRIGGMPDPHSGSLGAMAARETGTFRHPGTAARAGAPSDRQAAARRPPDRGAQDLGRLPSPVPRRAGGARSQRRTITGAVGPVIRRGERGQSWEVLGARALPTTQLQNRIAAQKAAGGTESASLLVARLGVTLSRKRRPAGRQPVCADTEYQALS